MGTSVVVRVRVSRTRASVYLVGYRYFLVLWGSGVGRGC